MQRTWSTRTSFSAISSIACGVLLVLVTSACVGSGAQSSIVAEPSAAVESAKPSLESVAQEALVKETGSACFVGADVLAILPSQGTVDALVASAGGSDRWTLDGTGFIGDRESAARAVQGRIAAEAPDRMWVIVRTGPTAVARELRRAVSGAGAEVWFPVDLITPCGVEAPSVP